MIILKSKTALKALKELVIEWEKQYGEKEILEYVWQSVKHLPLNRMKYIVRELTKNMKQKENMDGDKGINRKVDN